MAKVVKHISDHSSRKLGKRKAYRKKKIDLEQMGQMNLFTQEDAPKQVATLLSLTPKEDSFEQALRLDESGDDLAEKAYKKAIEQDILSADAYCNLGIIYASKGDSTQAISSFNHCLAQNPNHLEGHYNLGNMYFDLGNQELAIMHYKLALNINPNFHEVYYNLGLAYLSGQDYDNALGNLVSYSSIEQGDKEAEDLIRRIQILAKTKP